MKQEIKYMKLIDFHRILYTVKYTVTDTPNNEKENYPYFKNRKNI